MEQMTTGKFLSLTEYDLKDGTEFVEVCKDGNRKIEGCIRDGKYLEWDSDKIKKAFSRGRGTMADFKRFIEDNNRNLWMIELV